MKKRVVIFGVSIILWGIQSQVYGQPVVNFTLPDTSCVGAQINITNLTTGGITYYWDFCSGNANTTPVGINIGNPGNSLNEPTYITLVQDSIDCFSFVTNQGDPTHITRYYHGSSFRNSPINWTDLATSATSWEVEGIQIKKDNGNWYGFENYNMTILRLDFGPSLWNNNPAVTDLGITTPISVAHGLIILKEGNTWLGFFDSADQDELFRLNFGTSLTNIPTLEDFGNLGGFSHPGQLIVQEENGLWYILVSNLNSSTISRINFGNSLLNTPTGSNLGNLGGVQSPVGLTYIKDCETSTGYFTVYQSSGSMGKLIFPGGIGGSITAQIIGNIGDLAYPHCFSEIFRQNDSLFAYITNWETSSFTQLSFPPCNNASIPSSNQYTPPPFSYNQPGTYHVRLQVDAGLPDKEFLCKTIVILSALTYSFDTTIGCGEKYYAGGAMQSQSGTYYDTLPATSGCDSVRITHLMVKSRILVNLGGNRSICPGEQITLNATLAGATYTWQNSSTDSIFLVTEPGTYWVHVNYNNCSGGDTVQITDCPGELWFPNAFTPNGDGLNDLFRPKGISITKFHMMIYSRWGQLLYETDDMVAGWDGTVKGTICPADTYTFIATYEGTDNLGETKKKQGSFILIR